MTPDTDSGPINAAGTYTVRFDSRGRSHLGKLRVPLQLDGIVVDDQRRMVLAELPSWPAVGRTTGLPRSGPGAMAFWRGQAYFVDSTGAAIRVRDCDGGTTRFVDVRCYQQLDALDADETELTSLATTPRDTLLIASRARSTVYEFDLPTAQSVWSWRDLDGVDDVTVTGAGDVYATCDRGVVRLIPYAGAAVVVPFKRGDSRPKSIAWGEVDGAELLFVARGTRVMVIDLETGTLTRFDLRAAIGRLVRGTGIKSRSPLSSPIALRWHDGRLYVGSPRSPAIRVLDTRTRAVLGDLPGRQCEYTAFGVDGDGSLWITDGLVASRSEQSRPVDVGSARLGPVPIRLDQATEHTLRVRLVGRATGAGGTVSIGFAPLLIGPRQGGVSSDVVVRVPLDATEVVVLVALAAGGPGLVEHSQSTAIHAVELRVDEPGWIDDLPAIYRDASADPQVFLDPFLQLARTGLDEVIDALLALPAQMTPSTAIDDLEGDRWLDWLGTWVDVELDEMAGAATRRKMVAGAFARHGIRGTAESLRKLIELELGIAVASIVQPGDVASVWVLGADSAQLGMGTMTAAAPPSGSILDSTAVVRRSHLVGPGDYGAPLFGDLANRFHVLVHAARVRCPDDRDRLEALIERERPAHTTAHLCVIEPGISVGIQARVGVDAVIGRIRHPHALRGLEGFTAQGSHDRFVLGEDDRERLVLT